jgi:hypothetical protein
LDSGYKCMICHDPPEETVEHLSFHCSSASTCWATLNLCWTTLGDKLQIISQGKQNCGKSMFMEVFMVGTWNIWKVRNIMHFKGIPLDLDTWKTSFKEDFSLLVHRTKHGHHPFITFVVGSFYSSTPHSLFYICNCFLPFLMH